MKSSSSLECLYNTYSPMLYGIALEVSPTQKDAEEILIKTFQKAHIQNLIKLPYLSVCAILIQLAIQTAQEHLKPGQAKSNFKLKQFENTPLLHKLLCERLSLRECCEESNLTHIEVSKKVREEVTSLREFKHDNAGAPNIW